jgi:mono/diheme cytochrome c family protein
VIAINAASPFSDEHNAHCSHLAVDRAVMISARSWWIVCVACLAVSGCASGGKSESSSLFSTLMDVFRRKDAAGSALNGRTVAQRKCVKCHALQGTSGSSQAASFSQLSQRAVLTREKLNEVLSEFPHPMPAISLTSREISDLIAYMRVAAIMAAQNSAF